MNLTYCSECGAPIFWFQFERKDKCPFCGGEIVTESLSSSSWQGEKTKTKIIKPLDSDFEISDGVLLYYKGNKTNVVIPEGIKAIGEKAFKYGSLRRIRLPLSLERIEDEAFCGSKLFAIQFPKSLSWIGDSAFSYCYNLEHIDFGLVTKLNSVNCYAFSECCNLKTAELPSSVEVVRERAFAFSCSLSKVVLKNKNCKLCSEAFIGCDLVKIER